jgi:hypothetical protein
MLTFRGWMQNDPWPELPQVRAILANYNITPAAFGYYDPPPGYWLPGA